MVPVVTKAVGRKKVVLPMEIKDILGINPVLLTSIATSFVAVCGALGVKELLSKAYERYCKKEDEADTDHKQLLAMQESIDEILARLDKMEDRDHESMVNDMLIIEDRLLWMQRKAIQVHKVSRKCMPRYQILYKRYLELNNKSDIDLNEEILFNDKVITNMINEGHIVETWEEALK